MNLNQLLIRSEPNSQAIRLQQFLDTPQQFLSAAEDWVWLGTEITFEQIELAAGSLAETNAGIVQFHSDPVLEELLAVAGPAVNASMGVTGLTAVRSSLLNEVSGKGASLSHDVVLLMELFERCGETALRSAAGTSFDLLSSIPAHEAGTDEGVLRSLTSIDDESLLREMNRGVSSAEIRAGLLLIHDFLEPSHEFSQSIQGQANGDYWHGLMHRREPDFGNSKYWFRRVGDHPCFPRVSESARQLAMECPDDRIAAWVEKMAGSGWDSMTAVDFFQEAHKPDNRGTAFHQFAERLQMREMLILLAHCCQAVT